jgi:N,N'-diacetylbacillosaminyl-diphospho-undecaprenol alpha-1,3-N-acetylgalactosaminyltransferase
MKIAFLSHLDLNLYLFRLPIMIELINAGHKVYAICPEGEKFKEFKRYGVTALSYDVSRKSLNPLKELKTIYGIYKTIKPLDLDILHNFTAKPNIYGTISGHFAKVPKIINSITGLGSFYIQTSIKASFIRTMMESLYKIVNKRAHNVIFQNGDDMDYFIQKHIVTESQAVLIRSSGIDSSLYERSLVSELNINLLKSQLKITTEIIILMVARAIWDKGVREYYEAADILTKKYKNIKFIFAGGTDDGNVSCANERFLRHSDVLWLGQRDDILELTELSDIYVLPSYREGVPRTLLEAASMSKPIVTTNAVGCREVVEDGWNGYLVPIRNSEKLSEKIETLYLNEELRNNMGKNGRIKVVKDFDVRVVVKRYLDVYEKII